jgi:hypothetical protein
LYLQKSKKNRVLDLGLDSGFHGFLDFVGLDVGFILGFEFEKWRSILELRGS